MWRQSFGGAMAPWREMERMCREMNRLFADSPTGFGGYAARGYPAMNIWTNENGVIVTAELPGVKAEDIEVSVVNDTLTLTGERKPEEPGEEVTYHRRERGAGRFTRSFQLPYQIEAGKVEAKFAKGVLHIMLPRAEADKPRKIAVRMA